MFFEGDDFFFSSFTCDLPDSSIGNVLIGPCGILGTTQRSFPFQGYDYICWGVHYSKESRESFVAFVELFYTILKGAIPDAKFQVSFWGGGGAFQRRNKQIPIRPPY